MTRLGFAGLAMAAAVATMSNVGLAKAAPRPMSRKEIALADPPMPDLLPAILPEEMTSTIDSMAEKRRLARLPASELAAIKAAEAKRQRRRDRNRAAASAGGALPPFDFQPRGKETSMSTTMRAKVRVGSVLPFAQEGKVTSERLTFHGVSKSDGYPADGSDENNTFSKFSPSVLVDIHCANPALFDRFKPGDTFYVDFTPAG